MSTGIHKSRVGFVVVKFRAFGKSLFLLRKNERWNDVNFLGGHEKQRDKGSLHKTAERELWEEVPSIRSLKGLSLEPLTDELRYGPVFSRSRAKNVEYEVQFFLLRFENGPEQVIEQLGVRSRNVFVSEEELLTPKQRRISGLISLLNSKFHGGLSSIPFSSTADVGSLLQNRSGDPDDLQLRFSLN